MKQRKSDLIDETVKYWIYKTNNVCEVKGNTPNFCTKRRIEVYRFWIHSYSKKNSEIRYSEKIFSLNLILDDCIWNRRVNVKVCVIRIPI